MGNSFCNSYSVSMGFFVLFTHPSLLLIRCTCVSTPMPSLTPSAVLMYRVAIFTPTPGYSINYYLVVGSPFSQTCLLTYIIFLVFLLLKLAYLISYNKFYYEIWLIMFGFNPYFFNLYMIFPVISSFVWIDNIRAINVWYFWIYMGSVTSWSI